MFSFRSDEQNRLSFKLRVRAVNGSWLHIGTGSLKLKFSRDTVDRIAKLRESDKLTLEALEKIAEEMGKVRKIESRFSTSDRKIEQYLILH